GEGGGGGGGGGGYGGGRVSRRSVPQRVRLCTRSIPSRTEAGRIRRRAKRRHRISLGRGSIRSTAGTRRRLASASSQRHRCDGRHRVRVGSQTGDGDNSDRVHQQ